MDLTDIRKPEHTDPPSKQHDSPKEEYDRITLAKCGMNCTECRFAEECDCPGCMQGKLFDDEECPVYDCCVRKGYVHCGECRNFPCAELRDASFDPETGDDGARLMRLKELSDKDYSLNRRRVMSVAAGLCLGLCAGLVIGAAYNSMAAWIFAGITVGIGIGIIFSISGGKR